MPTRFVPFSNFERLASSMLSPRPFGLAQIPMDAVQEDSGLILHFDLPGVAEERLELSVERRVLTIRAERPRLEGEVVVSERPWGEVSRQVVLGDSLDTENLKATFDNGVLTVTVPRRTDARARRIEVSHGPIEVPSSVESN